jgi:hypothetical protein
MEGRNHGTIRNIPIVMRVVAPVLTLQHPGVCSSTRDHPCWVYHRRGGILNRRFTTEDEAEMKLNYTPWDCSNAFAPSA